MDKRDIYRLAAQLVQERGLPNASRYCLEEWEKATEMRDTFLAQKWHKVRVALIDFSDLRPSGDRQH